MERPAPLPDAGTKPQPGAAPVSSSSGDHRLPRRQGGRPSFSALSLVGQQVVLGVVFLVSRVLLDVAGVRFNMVSDWMFLADPADLRSHLAQTLYYYHAFPPGMNVISGVLLKLSEAHPGYLAHGLFHGLDLILCNALFYMGRVLGLSPRVALVFVLAFSLTPQVIFFEHLYLYETPVIAPLCLATALLHRAVERPTFWSWLPVFALCAVLGWIRSSYHLLWYFLVVGLALLFVGRRTWRPVVGAALAPAALLVALYAKNLVVFDVFDAQTWGPGTMTTATIRRLAPDDRSRLIQQGKLSPYAAVDVYRGPRAYLPFFDRAENPRWPPMMNALEQPSSGAPNYNHWFFLPINKRRADDVRFYFKERRSQYLKTVLWNLGKIFSPSTHWHPHDTSPESPHWEHRKVLGWYEAGYDRLVHGFPFAPVGVYPFLVLACFWGARRAWSLCRSGRPGDRAASALLGFMLFQIAFVIATGILFAAGEAQRYRFQVDPFLWAVGLLCAVAFVRWWRSRRSIASPPGERIAAASG